MLRFNCNFSIFLKNYQTSGRRLVPTVLALDGGSQSEVDASDLALKGLTGHLGTNANRRFSSKRKDRKNFRVEHKFGGCISDSQSVYWGVSELADPIGKDPK